MKKGIIGLVIGMIVATMIFPMIMIPFMGIGIVIWGLYVLLHDIIWNNIIHARKESEHTK
jgi:hypothetical protein